ncbi:sulfoxide reductase heme-binding subunit YedZ [Aquincola sp. S2]|uniref:Protein-methionine-sulfoxide reductase heme-binding subunit MsrQ n=1 Tax=Pseudaquabacterium terrae TaxID=2732868 RepID=A0ABX2EIS4_9BURK|nr:protein-methionine-sulfoxide reductase heme-binding subunit MsrQ [Aquabacterium terrae]NRF68469.1 sulfoxide reductase heme-binding subunit YedZ [Aquabacterium terrae]
MPGWTSTSFVKVFVLALPAIVFFARDWAGPAGINPLERLVREPGWWALTFLLATLAITPLRHAGVRVAKWCGTRWGRRLADWNWLVRLRRWLGLASFAYALAHVAVYATLDLGLQWREFVADLRAKPFMVAGLAAFVLLIPLAVTSTDAWMRRLKRNWKRLHWLVYPAGVLAVLHFVWLSKPGVLQPYAYALALGVLLGWRVVVHWCSGKSPFWNQEVRRVVDHGNVPIASSRDQDPCC